MMQVNRVRISSHSRTHSVTTSLLSSRDAETSLAAATSTGIGSSQEPFDPFYGEKHPSFDQTENL